MGRYALQHRRALADSLRFLRDRPGATAIVWLLLGVALSLPAGLYLLAGRLGELDARLNAAPAISVFLKPGIESATATALAEQVRAMTAVASVALEPPEAGLDVLGLGGGAEAAAAYGLPLVMLVGLATDASAEALATELRRLPGADEVIAESRWRDRLRTVERVLGRFGILLCAILTLAVAGLAGGSVRLALDERMDELRVGLLIGATDAQLRRPFVYLGAGYGVGGAVVATVVLAAGAAVLAGPVGALGDAYGIDLVFGLPPAELPFLLLSAGVALGVGGAAAGVSGALARVAIR